jgi:hypothetical protein
VATLSHQLISIRFISGFELTYGTIPYGTAEVFPVPVELRNSGIPFGIPGIGIPMEFQEF